MHDDAQEQHDEDESYSYIFREEGSSCNNDISIESEQQDDIDFDDIIANGLLELREKLNCTTEVTCFVSEMF